MPPATIFTKTFAITPPIVLREGAAQGGMAGFGRDRDPISRDGSWPRMRRSEPRRLPVLFASLDLSINSRKNMENLAQTCPGAPFGTHREARNPTASAPSDAAIAMPTACERFASGAPSAAAFDLSNAREIRPCVPLIGRTGRGRASRPPPDGSHARRPAGGALADEPNAWPGSGPMSAGAGRSTTR